jgi:hypothetical protein
MKDALNEDNALIEAGPDAPEVATCLGMPFIPACGASSYCAADDTAGDRRRTGSLLLGRLHNSGKLGWFTSM